MNYFMLEKSKQNKFDCKIKAFMRVFLNQPVKHLALVM